MPVSYKFIKIPRRDSVCVSSHISFV